MERIKTCRSCGGKNIVEFFDLGVQPFANSLLKSPDEKEKSYPLSLSFCPDCSLVQLNHTADPAELFSNYVWVTATSSTAQEHARRFCQEALSRAGGLKNSYVLEAASNDGTFLKPFIEKGIKVLGVDPAKNIAEKAAADGIPTKNRFFGEEAAREIIAESGRAGIVIARNVLPHVANLHDFVEGLRLCLAEDGLLAIEFHYARVIYDGLHYDSIYHEHLCYYTLKSLESLLNKHHLFVKDVSESPISGGSLIVYAGHGKGKETAAVQEYRSSEQASGVTDLGRWQDFARRAYKHREKMLKMLTDVTQKSGAVVGYGASARSSTLLNFCGIGKQFVSIIADQNSLKQGLYTAGTHIPIVSPEQAMKTNPECVLILAWNFADEITGILRDKFSYRGQCILPLPNDPRIISLSK